MSSRHLSRSIAMQSLYEWDFYDRKVDLEKIIEKNTQEFGPNLKDKTFSLKLAQGVVKHLAQLNDIIEKAAPQWPIDQISIVDRNVLRIGLQELLYGDAKAVPPKVAINEAIELAKSFGGEASGKFINGVLGTVFEEMPDLLKSNIESENIPEEIQSGGLVYRSHNGIYQIALVLDVFGYWTFPKGRLEKGETHQQALKREIAEEIGIQKIEIIKELGKRTYITKNAKKQRIKKIVTDFLVEAIGNTEIKFKESSGLKNAKWFNLDEISSLKQYKETREALLKTINDFIGEDQKIK